jgi:hypothetical protein
MAVLVSVAFAFSFGCARSTKQTGTYICGRKKISEKSADYSRNALD